MCRLFSSRCRPALLLAACLLLAALCAPSSASDFSAAGISRSETWITAADGERLHALTFLPHDKRRRHPVILIVTPYLHPGAVTSPAEEFYVPRLAEAGLFTRGYALVMVSLRGTGGSSGCLDLLGPGEQTDVVSAVRWAATQEWSTGKVGMYGFSYDANTALAGTALRPPGLAAVVAMEGAPDAYRGAYNDRVRLMQSLAFPAVYGANGEPGPRLDGSIEYNGNALGHSADCQLHLRDHYLDEKSLPFWRQRDMVRMAAGSTVPTMLAAGYLDANTNIGAGAPQLFQALRGPKRMWLGWWYHVTPDEVAGDEPITGRSGWHAETLRFLDEHLKGKVPPKSDPLIAAQSSDGTWTAEGQWPPTDTRHVTASLLPGQYEDDATNTGSRDPASGPNFLNPGLPTRWGFGSWTFSAPLARTARLIGEPQVDLRLTVTVPRSNLVVNLYDIAPDGAATMVTRGSALIDTSGRHTLTLWPADWTYARGHRLGVLVSGANADAFVHVPTRSTVAIETGQIRLPWLPARPRARTTGFDGAHLRGYHDRAPFDVPQAVVTSRTNPSFPPPP